jgi:probable rRNA maturation factor
MINVHISGEDANPRFNALLMKAAETTLSQQNADASFEMSIMLGDDDLLEKLNQKHSNEKHPTDVLSFPGGEVNPETGNVYLGDIAISLSRAIAQAEAGNHSLEDELQLLVVHGVLHLLGHDHAKQEEKALMWIAQKELLSSLEISLDLESLDIR